MLRRIKTNESMYIIEEIKKLHSSDIKDIAVMENYIVTVGRDMFIKTYDYKGGNLVERKPVSVYINSVVAKEIDNRVEVFAGCQNGMIVRYENILFDAPPQFLAGHIQNVCALDFKEGLLASGSWDNTARIWDESTELLCLPHPATVWDIKVVTPNDYVTCCADGRIRVFHQKFILHELVYQVGCVRSISVIDDFLIYSISNDGKLIASNRNGDILHHTDFNELTYGIDCNDDNIAVCGENGLVSITTKALKYVFLVDLPVQTCWKVRLKNKKVYACGSDGRIYVFAHTSKVDSLKSARAEEELETLRNAREPTKKPVKDFENKNYKVIDGIAYQRVGEEWVPLGEVVDVKKEYDYTFDVSLDDKMMKLQLNKNDNFFEVADRFISANKLDYSFRNEIVDFIKKNVGCQEEDYFVYSGINASGAIKYISKYDRNEEVIRQLTNTDLERNELLEDELVHMLQCASPGEYFPILDCYRYFLTMGFQFELVFLFSLEAKTKKEAVVFTRLVTNLYTNPPFNLECLHSKIRSFYDASLIDEETFNKYNKNRALRMKKK
ncbi:Ubiquitin homeostasis protein lub1 [Astathelohania contejeani]|uniref:Ubiquitin homeostasis protein lub1 n=1 Tax=Astathelohania contejeani TaxID=164912 RepID=A0ABQ7I1B4_9MICR|nr:Ubiquitin homeostasis protein lub1 [Thelohania contejeani]